MCAISVVFVCGVVRAIIVVVVHLNLFALLAVIAGALFAVIVAGFSAVLS